ncbi:hypothetical protein RFI_34735 [Reticulomyxa filosa]|uniref:Uncharacterized protein n=1 Tax=Reticulomyxa filosa TaxID=46433 RepID=X6LL46_RETFI|nr:hypothetical protein RFI_34735 [Reticulomyxa filosa]|eukprot:ETO02678.1 hypothetical protein RFI_34735 [Reticulomyxa filosa]
MAHDGLKVNHTIESGELIIMIMCAAYIPSYNVFFCDVIEIYMINTHVYNIGLQRIQYLSYREIWKVAVVVVVPVRKDKVKLVHIQLQNVENMQTDSIWFSLLSLKKLITGINCKKEQEDYKEKSRKKKIMKKSIVKQELQMRMKKDTNNDDNDSRNVVWCSLHDKIIHSWISKVNTNFIN